MKSPIDLLVSLFADLNRLQPDVKGLDRDIHTIKNRFEDEGYGFLTIALPAFGDNLFQGLSCGKFRSPLGFKTRRGSVLPRFLGGLLSDVFDPSSGLVKDNASVESVSSLRQICYLFKKVPLDPVDSDRLHDKAIETFFSTDDLIGGSSLSDRDEHLLGAVCSYFLPDLCKEEYSGINFKHGPGSVAEQVSSNQKWSGVFSGLASEAFDTDLFGFSDFALVDRIDLSSTQSSIIEESDRPLFCGNKSFSSSAKLVSVAKNSTSRRLITIEPLLHQFLQQGLRTVLIDSIDKCGILSSSIALTNQSLNQKLALEGSKLLNWSTLDLKSASDLMSLQLVKTVFRHRPGFVQAMSKCRTESVNCNGVTTNIKKFGGMGNALTFPIQSIVFTALAVTAILDTRGHSPTRGRVRAAAKCVRVYGDDIVVKTEYARQVAVWLTNAGLVVNERKSFFDGYFKESCGVDAYKGVDVTPLYCRFQPHKTSREASTIEQMVAFSNNAWMRGYHQLATVVSEQVESLLGRRLPLVSRDSGMLGWHSRTDAVNPHKWDYKLQCFMTKALTSLPLLKKDRLDGWPALLKFFHVPLLGRPLNHLLESQRRFQLRSVWRWVPSRVKS